MQYGKSTQMEWTIPEEKALPVIKHAFDNGINTWDTVSHVLHTQHRAGRLISL